MFKRKAYSKLLEWKAKNGSSAMLIEGARRTGKSTLALEFAKNEYQDYLLINFDTVDEQVKEFFRHYRSNVDDFFKYLLAYLGVGLERRKSLVIFDEVQRFPLARGFIKQLVEDGRYDYLETGSLISIKKNVEDIIIPSEEEKIELPPFDFEEFLWANEEDALAELIYDSFKNGMPLPDPLHDKAQRLFREYMLVGGMPQSIQAYIDAQDFAAADEAKRLILDLYRQDIMKFGGDDASRAAAIFNAVPGQLSKHEKKFTFGSAEKGARYRNYAGAFFWLSDARLVNICRNVTDPSVGLELTSEENNLKCYLADTGLLATMAFGSNEKTDNALYKNVLLGKLGINEGMLTENVVAQQLAANGHKLYFYSKRDDKNAEDTMEIDFLIVERYENAGFKQRVSPIEVKSKTRYSTKSLEKFKEKFGRKVGTQYVLHPRQLMITGDRKYLPLYMVLCL